MDLFDLVFVCVALGAVSGGYRVGFATRVISWLGIAAGLVAGLRAVPWLLAQTDGAQHGLVVAATIAVILVPAIIGESLGTTVGRRLAPRAGYASRVDRVLGGVAGLVSVVAVVWMLLPVLSASAGWPSTLVADSTVEQMMREHLPEPPDVEAALQPLVGDDAFPRVFEALQPVPPAAPPLGAGLDDATVARVAMSVVRIEGTACRVTRVGSGFVVAEGFVVTNAHVVAGQRTTTVERDDGERLGAAVVAFDPEADLAVLSVPGMGRPALPIGATDRGDVGAVFGHPEGGPLRIAPFEVARLVVAVGRDIYDAAPARRDVLEVAAALRPGDSGAALVDARGAVVGVAFAIAPGDVGVAYALATSELRAILGGPLDRVVGAGPCID